VRISPLSPLLPLLSLLSAILLAGTPAAVAVAVPMPVEIRSGGAVAEDAVAWAPPIQVVDGPPGATVRVDLALDDGTAHPVTAALSVHELTTDDRDTLVPGDQSRLLRLATGRVALQPGDRGLLATTATIPAVPTLVAVRAELLDARTAAAPLAIVLLRPDHHTGRPGDLEVAIDDLDAEADRAGDGDGDGGGGSGGEPGVGGDGRAGVEVVVTNAGDADTIVDLAARARSWVGRESHHEVTGIALPAGTSRRITVPDSTGFGRRTVEVVAAARDGGTARTSVTAWGRRTVPTLLALGLVVVAGLATLVAVRRRGLP
jgi:hypothetical protein